MWSTLLSCVGAFAMFQLFKYLQLRSKLPPGPLGLPIFGNLLQLPASRPWLVFDQWQKQYGPICYVNIAGQNTVILGSHKAAADLLDRRASIYSNRPYFSVLNMITGGMLWSFAQADDLWRKQRRAAHVALSAKAVKDYFELQETESVIMLNQMLIDAEYFRAHFQRASTSLTLSVVYGLPPLMDSDHPVIPHIDRFNQHVLVAAVPGSFWVDHELFKWMRYLPSWMCAWKGNAEDAFIGGSVIFEGLAADVRKQINVDDNTTSLARKLLQTTEKEELVQAVWNSGTIYSAGAETTSSQLAWFIQAMILYPEAQRLAKEEIDRVVGRNRLPTFNDYNFLPYIRATVKEILRWRGVTPIGVPHRLSQDDYYEGYFLPKDTICLVNNWSLHHNKEIYGEDAEHFNPGRYLNTNGNLKSSIPDTRDEGHVSYGYGKRICIGRHLANNSLFIHIAFLLWAFDITAEVDAVSGKPKLPNPFQCEEGLVIRPAPFRCNIIRRNPEVSEMVAQAKSDRGIATSSSHPNR